MEEESVLIKVQMRKKSYSAKSKSQISKQTLDALKIGKIMQVQVYPRYSATRYRSTLVIPPLVNPPKLRRTN